jgi:hypothetical protein
MDSPESDQHIKTPSQSIARLFELAGYLIMLPLLPLLTVGICLTFSGGAVLVGAVAALMIGPGLLLQLGYRDHARGLLTRRAQLRIWLLTALYNASLITLELFYGVRFWENPLIPYGLPVYWQIAAIALALVAAALDWRAPI